MPRSRLSEAERADLIARYRAGATGPELAAATNYASMLLERRA